MSTREERLAQCPTPLVQLLSPKLLVYRDASDEKYGKIFIPENAKKPSACGTVILVGEGFQLEHEHEPEAFREYVPIKPGDRIVFSKYTGDDVGCRVDPEWWHRPENEGAIESMASLKQERLLEFVIIPPSAVHVILQYPDKEVWEEV